MQIKPEGNAAPIKRGRRGGAGLPSGREKNATATPLAYLGERKKDVSGKLAFDIPRKERGKRGLPAYSRRQGAPSCPEEKGKARKKRQLRLIFGRGRKGRLRHFLRPTGPERMGRHFHGFDLGKKGASSKNECKGLESRRRE